MTTCPGRGMSSDKKYRAYYFIVHAGPFGYFTFWAGILLVSQPVFLNHVQTPTTEMLQLFLWCGSGMVLPVRRKNKGMPIVIAMVLFAGVLNRISFVFFSGLFFFCMALTDEIRRDRKRVLLEHLLYSTGIMTGAWFDMTITHVATACLMHIIPTLFRAAALLCAGGFFLDFIFWHRRPRRWFFQYYRRWAPRF